MNLPGLLACAALAGTSVFAEDANTEVVREVINLARENELALHAHTDLNT